MVVLIPISIKVLISQNRNNMKNTILILIISLFIVTFCFAQNSLPVKPASFTVSPPITQTITSTTYPTQSNVFPVAVEMYDTFYDSSINAYAIDTFASDGRDFIAKKITTSFLIKNNSTLTVLPTGKIYRTKIIATGALSIGLQFKNLYLGSGATLYIYTPDSLMIRGAYTSINNDSVFNFLPLTGSTAIVEVFIPNGSTWDSSLQIKGIEYYFINYVNVAQQQLSLISSPTSADGCYANVYCRTNYYGGIERSVVYWTAFDNGGNGFSCSGALINQNVPANSLKTYFLTANHCGQDADLSTAIFNFIYQKSTCTATYPVAGLYTGLYTITGAWKKSSNGGPYVSTSGTDMYLMELKSKPSPELNVFYAGWDHRSYPSGSGDLMLGIHHPKNYDKRYSEGWLQRNVLVNKWRVKWNRNDEKYTDKGSSGSPLFEDVNGRIIGQLSTGPAKSGCDKLKSRFIWRYGKLYKSWGNLESFLDPTYSQTQLNGRIPCYDNLTMQNRTFPNAFDYQPTSLVKIQCGADMTFTPAIYGTSYFPNTFNYGANYLFTAGNSITIDAGGIDIPLGTTVEFNIGACTAY